MKQHQRRSKRHINRDRDRDRITALPEPIIHQILSFLLPNTKDVKVTSSLSRTWYRISSSFPYLDFHDSPFNRDTNEHLNYIDETLKRFHDHNKNVNLQIQRLTIPVTLRRSPIVTGQINYLDSWISLVLQHGVVEFNLNLTYPQTRYIERPYYDLPRDVFAVNSIKVARFQGISLLNSFPNKPINGSSSSCTLLKLSLDNVRLDELTLSYLICSCPLIEELSVFHCLGIKRLWISNLNKLKALRISSCLENKTIETVEIDAPSLRNLEIAGEMDIRVLECPKLTNMDLDHIVLEDLQLLDILSRLSLLHSLSLSDVFPLTKVKVSSDTLNKLIISVCDNLVDLDINAPNLLSIEYTGEFYPLASTSILNVPHVQWDASTGYNGFANPYTIEEFLVDLRNFISKAKHIEHLYLYFQEIDSFDSQELQNDRVVVDQPISIIDHLELGISHVLRNTYPDLIEGVLWICHPRTLSLRLDHHSLWTDNNNLVKCICKIIMYHHPARSNWIQCLEDIRYVTKEGTEDRLPMDGINVPYLCSSYDEIKFIFKW